MDTIKLIYIIILLVLAGWSDLKNRRIPNWLTIPSIVAGLLFALAIDGTTGLKYSAIGAAVGFFVFLLPFALGGMGGGDVKLLAAIGTLIGWPLIVWAILLSCVAALFASVAKAIWKGMFIRLLRSTWLIIKISFTGLLIRRPIDEIEEVTKAQAICYVPFGASIALGTAWTLVLQYLITIGIMDYLPYFKGV